MVKRYLETLRKEEAIARVLAAISPLEAEEALPAEASVGRITARPVTAAVLEPPLHVLSNGWLCSRL